MTREQRCEAFSLVEVLCAILVLGVAIAGLTQGLNTALMSSKESEVQTTAALLAAGQIETLRAEGYLADGVQEGAGTGAFALYRWEESIRSTSIDGLHEVTVTVQNAKTGKAIYELRTLLFEVPLSPGSSETTRQNDADKRRRERRWR